MKSDFNPFKSDDQKQFETDLKANEDASDKLDKELNHPVNHINPFSPDDVKHKLDSSFKSTAGTKTLKDVIKQTKLTPKQRILEEHGGLEANIPLFHHYWQLP